MAGTRNNNSLPETVNKQKQRWMVYGVICIFASISLLVLTYSTVSMIARRDAVVLSEWVIFIFLNGFVLGASFFFCWRAYQDLRIRFTEEGIHHLALRGARILRWSDIRRIAVHELSATPFKLVIKGDAQQVTLVALFYKDHASLLRLFKTHLDADVTWEQKEIR